MIRDPHADGSALLMLQPAGCFTSRVQQKRVGARQADLQNPELPGIELREMTDLREAPTDQCEVVVPVGLADTSHPLQGVFVTEMPAKGVAGIRGISDDPAAT